MNIMTPLGIVISDTALTIIIAQIPITITAIAGLIISIRNGGKSDKIATAVDGTASKLQNDLSEANGRIEQLIRSLPVAVQQSVAAPKTEPEKVEIVQPDDKPVPTKTIKNP